MTEPEKATPAPEALRHTINHCLEAITHIKANQMTEAMISLANARHWIDVQEAAIAALVTEALEPA